MSRAAGLASPRPQFLGIKPGFAFWSIAIALLAFAIREYFVLATIVDIPFRGDTREYALYAWNLYHYGTFSLTEPGHTPIVPDAFRAPGYPWLLWLCMRLSADHWYDMALQMQVLAGTATVWLCMLLGRRWLGMGWACAAGTLLALWPHHVVASGALLSECVFGLCLMGSLYTYARAIDAPTCWTVAIAAVMFGFAYLVNPLIALFPPLLALELWRRHGTKVALAFLGLFLVPVLGWNLRNLTLDTSSGPDRAGRVAINLVQGSWPDYHWAWQMQRFGDPASVATMREIDRETALVSRAPLAGAAAVASRFKSRPGYYARWYLWDKPALLWDWEIRLGPGEFYVLEVRHSPFQTHPLLRFAARALEFANPLLTLLAFLGGAGLLLGALRSDQAPPAAALTTAGLFFYLTLLHTVFQAEPRYANAYRGVELLLVMSTLQWLAIAACRSRSK